MPPCSLSVPPPPAPPASPPSFTRSDSSSACISCQARILHWQWKAGRVWYLTAWTSWLWIYADDESRCPPATLLLPLLWSVYSSNISTIMILLWSTILLCLFLVLFQLLSVPAIVQNTSGLKLSHKDILQNFILPFCFCYSADFTVNFTDKDFKKLWISWFDNEVLALFDRSSKISVAQTYFTFEITHFLKQNTITVC